MPAIDQVGLLWCDVLTLNKGHHLPSVLDRSTAGKGLALSKRRTHRCSSNGFHELAASGLTHIYREKLSRMTLEKKLVDNLRH